MCRIQCVVMLGGCTGALTPRAHLLVSHDVDPANISMCVAMLMQARQGTQDSHDRVFKLGLVSRIAVIAQRLQLHNVISVPGQLGL